MSWMVKLSPKKIVALLGILATVGATVPLTGGASVAVLGPSIAAVTETELASLILTCSISAGLLIALLKNYDVEFDFAQMDLRFKRK